MNNLKELQPQKIVVKIILVGNSQVGKSAFLKQWIKSEFPANKKATIGVDFGLKELSFQEKNETVSIQVWEIAGSEKQHQTIANYFNGANFFIIMISSHESADIRIQQIIEWRNIIKSKCLDRDYKIMIIENQIDVGTPLTPDQIKSAKNIDEDFIAISIKEKIGFEQFENTLKDIMLSIVYHTKSATLQKSSLQTHTNPPIDREIFRNISDLNEAHAELLLHYIEDFIRYGTTKNPDKPYELAFFSGVSYQYETDLQEDRHSKKLITLQLPEHVPQLLNYIKNKNLIPTKDILLQIYVKSLEIATLKPFFRKSTTQQYYALSLPSYINKSSTIVTFRNYQKIKTLKKENITQVLTNLRDFILLGVHNDRGNPYTVGFCGGTPYSYEIHHIKLPKYLAIIVGAIDMFFSKKNTTEQESQICLCDIYHKIISASVLPAYGRDNSTQNFYDNLLLDKLKSEINTVSELRINDNPSLRLSTCL